MVVTWQLTVSDPVKWTLSCPTWFYSVLCVAAALLDRDFLVSRERERKLQNDLEVVTARLLHQEQMNMELRMKQNQLISRIHEQQVEQEHSCSMGRKNEATGWIFSWSARLLVDFWPLGNK